MTTASQPSPGKTELILSNEQYPSIRETIHDIPQELLWKANFNSENSIDTYDNAIRSFLNFLQIESPEEELSMPMSIDIHSFKSAAIILILHSKQ